jgi:hypothetical protein
VGVQVDLSGVSFESFNVPRCKLCIEEGNAKEGIVKPNVVFFVSRRVSRIKAFY